MTASDDEPELSAGDKPVVPGSLARWRDTCFIWLTASIGGGGLWLSVADPIFGGPQLAPAAWTMFAFFVSLGVVATLLIWCWPAVWHRWFHLMPAQGSRRLEAARMGGHAVFWIFAILLVAGMVTWQWNPFAAGAAGGCLMLGRLVLDIVLQHWLGDS